MIIDKTDLRPIMHALRDHLSYGTDGVFYPETGVVSRRDLDFVQGSFDQSLFLHEHPLDSHYYRLGDTRSLYETLFLLDKGRASLKDYATVDPNAISTTINVGKLQEERQLATDLHHRMKKADWYYDYSDDPGVWLKGGKIIQDIVKDLGRLSQTHYGMTTAKQLWDSYVPPHSVTRPSFFHLSNHFIMNEQNFDYLKKQIKLTGYGVGHEQDLRDNLEKKIPAFTLYHQGEFDKDSVVGTLHFKKSDSSDMVFFNRHTVILKNEKNPDAIRQTFYIESGKDNVTLKEAYNLLSGRAVEKNLETKEGEKYRAWLQLNFKETDKHGNYIVKQYHQKYGFDLEKSLLTLPLKLENPDQKNRLMESLQRGNRQTVTLEIEGKERKIAIEAAPQFKGLNYFDEQGKRIRLEAALKLPEQVVGEKNTAKESKQQKNGKGDDDLEEKQNNKQSKRRQVHH